MQPIIRRCLRFLKTLAKLDAIMSRFYFSPARTTPMKRSQNTFYDFGLTIAIIGLALAGIGVIAEYYW